MCIDKSPEFNCASPVCTTTLPVNVSPVVEAIVTEPDTDEVPTPLLILTRPPVSVVLAPAFNNKEPPTFCCDVPAWMLIFPV